jgi:hypothetical protein
MDDKGSTMGKDIDEATPGSLHAKGTGAKDGAQLGAPMHAGDHGAGRTVTGGKDTASDTDGWRRDPAAAHHSLFDRA